MPDPSISTCFAGSLTIRKTSAGLAVTVWLVGDPIGKRHSGSSVGSWTSTH
jgi:hypothetical protein